MSVDRKIVEVGRAFRLSGAAMVRRILLPAVLPAYVVSMRSGLGLGWMFVIAAEFMGASEGLGYLLIDGQQLGKPAEIVAAIVAFAVIGKTTDAIVAAWPRRSCAGRTRFRPCERRTEHAESPERVGKTYPNGVHALDAITLGVAPGEIVVVIGGSGCGKSTLLRAISGLDTPTQGSVLLDGETDHHAAREDRHHLPGAAPAAVAHRRRQRRLRHRGPAEARTRRARRPRARSRRPDRQGRRSGRANCPAARRSASPSPARWCRGRRCCCSTSRSRRSTPSPASTCRITCSTCGPNSSRRWSWSPTTSRRRSRSPTAIVVMRPHPGQIADEIEIDLPRPRDRQSAAFDFAKRRVLAALDRSLDRAVGSSIPSRRPPRARRCGGEAECPSRACPGLVPGHPADYAMKRVRGDVDSSAALADDNRTGGHDHAQLPGLHCGQPLQCNE